MTPLPLLPTAVFTVGYVLLLQVATCCMWVPFCVLPRILTAGANRTLGLGGAVAFLLGLLIAVGCLMALLYA